MQVIKVRYAATLVAPLAGSWRTLRNAVLSSVLSCARYVMRVICNGDA